MSKKNRVLVSLLILMGAAMLGSCNAGETNAASAAVALLSDCVSSVL